MRFNNIQSKHRVVSIYFLLIILSIITSLLFNPFKEGFILNRIWEFIPLFLIAVIVLVYKNAKFFEFDGDGSVLSFLNKDLLLSNFINFREQRAEFPMEKLTKYKIYNYILFSGLYLYVNSKNDKITRLHFNISFVSYRKKRILKKSLDKVLELNNSSL